jgi:tetratricopeptide (TPR) repeat protein
VRLHRTIRQGLFAGALLLGVPSAAFAEDPKAPPADPGAGAAAADEQAARFLNEGNKAFKEGRFAEAERAYRQAFALKKVYDIAGNLAMSEFAQNKTREAAEHLAFALRLFPITGEPAVREQMQKTFDQCKGAVASIHTTIAPKGAQVFVDGKPAGEAPLADDVFVDVGPHTVEAKLDGYEDGKQDVRADKGAAATVTLTLKALPPKVVVRKEKEQVFVAAPKRSVVPTIVIGGAALVAAGVGGALLGISGSKASSALDITDKLRGSNRRCTTTSADPDCVSLFDGLKSADSLHNAGVGVFIGAGVLAAAAVTYLLLPAPAARKASALSVTATPIAGAGQGGLLLSGAF